MQNVIEKKDFIKSLQTGDYMILQELNQLISSALIQVTNRQHCATETFAPPQVTHESILIFARLSTSEFSNCSLITKGGFQKQS